MARVFQSGFETGTLSILAAGQEFVSTTNAPALVTSPVRTGGYALRAIAGSAPYVTTPITLTNHYVAFWVYLAGTPTANQIICGSSTSGVQLTTNRTVALLNGGSTVGTSTATVPLTTWTRIEWHFQTGTGTAVFQLKVGTAETLEVDVTNATAASGIVCSLGAVSGDLGQTIYLDDCAINDTTGVVNTSWVGMTGGIVQLVPSADATPNAWSTSGSPASHAAAVADLTGIDTAIYLLSTSKTANLEDCWTVTDTPAALASDATVPAVQWGIRGGGTGTTDRFTVLRLTDTGGNTVDSPAHNWNLNNWKTVVPAFMQEAWQIGQAVANKNIAVYGAGGTEEAYAQALTLVAGTYTAVDLYAQRAGSAPTDNITVALVSALDGTPSASVTVALSTLSNSMGWMTFTFPTPVTLTAGAMYLQITRSGTRDTTNYLRLSYGDPGTYAGGRLWTKTSGSWGVTAVATDDLTFRLSVQLSKSILDGLTAAILDTDTSTRQINITGVWASVAFQPTIPSTLTISVTATCCLTSTPTVTRILTVLDAAVTATASLTATVSLVRTPLRPSAVAAALLTATVTVPGVPLRVAAASTTVLSSSVTLGLVATWHPTATVTCALTATVSVRGLTLALTQAATASLTATVSLVCTPLRPSAASLLTLSAAVPVPDVRSAVAVLASLTLTDAASAALRETTVLAAAVTCAVSTTVTVQGPALALQPTARAQLTATALARLTPLRPSAASLTTVTATALVRPGGLVVAVHDALAVTAAPPPVCLAQVPVAVAQTVALADGAALTLTPLLASVSQSVRLSATGTVLRAVEGLWQVSVATALAVTSAVTVHQPVLTLAVSETMGLTESQTATGTLARAVTSALALTTTVAVAPLAVPCWMVAVSETVTLGSLGTALQVLAPQGVDTVAVSTTSQAMLGQVLLTGTDVLTVSEVPVGCVTPLHVAPTQAVHLTTTVTVLRAIAGVWHALTASTLSLTTSVAVHWPVLRVGVSEAVTLTEAQTFTGTVGRAVSSRVTLSEWQGLRLPVLRPAASTAAVALRDAAVLVVPLLHVAQTQTVRVTEGVGVLRGIEGVWQPQVTALLVGAAQVTLAVTTAAQGLSVLTCTEAVTLTTTTSVVGSDALRLTDAATVQVSTRLTLQSTLALSDVPTVFVPWVVPTATETMALVPSVQLVLPLLHAGAASATTLSATAVVYKVPEGTLILTHVEPALRLTEAVQLRSTTTVPVAAAVTLAATVQVSLALTPLLVDALTATEAPAVGLQMTLRLTEVLRCTPTLTLHVQRQPRHVWGRQAALRRSQGIQETLRQGTATGAALRRSQGIQETLRQGTATGATLTRSHVLEETLV